MNCFANAVVGPATTQVALVLDDVLVTGIGDALEPVCGVHDLARLAVSTLSNIFVDPSLLNGVQLRAAETLDGGDAFPRNARNRGCAGTYGSAIDVHGAGSAKARTTAKFRALEFGSVSDYPKQRRSWVAAECECTAIKRYLNHVMFPLIYSEPRGATRMRQCGCPGVYDELHELWDEASVGGA